MKRSLLLILTLFVFSCGGEPAEEETLAAAETAASETATAEGYVDKVTRAQDKARKMAAEEGERVKEVDDAMKDQ